ncbi:MAG: thiamine phosphate synthase [Candidatus Margulisiibacteriota bacterium]
MNPKVLRIIDANTNRLMEGLRVIEEVARFVLDDKKLTEKIKSLRGRVKEGIKLIGKGDDLLGKRDSVSDVGKNMYPVSESERPDISSIITSNIKRAEEAARVLEEFGKLANKEAGRIFKLIRFELYDIEKQLIHRCGLQSASISDKLNFDLYVVTDPDVLGKRSPVEAVKQVIKGGCKMLQLRDKKAPIGQYYKWAEQIAPICKKAGVAFIVNDYLDVCMAVDADGIHLGQDDIPVAIARKLLGNGKLIGISTHSFDQAIKGVRSGADYISVGPIFPTASKPNTKPLGLDILKKISTAIHKSSHPIPFVAIGGINESNIKDVIKLSPRVAVIRAAIGERDIAGAVRKLIRRMK